MRFSLYLAVALMVVAGSVALADNTLGPYQAASPGAVAPPIEIGIPNGSGMIVPPNSSTPLTVGISNEYLYTDLGSCQLAAISAATALIACAGGIPSGATTAVITVEGEPIRWRGDNTAPTASVGNLQPVGQFTYAGQPLAHFQAIPTTGSATLDIEFFK